MEAMARHRTHRIEFKRQFVQEYLSGETLRGLAKRYNISRNLIRIWLQKHDAGAFDDDAVAVDTIEAYEARIAALEIAQLKGALRHAPRARSATMSVVTGPTASSLRKDAG
jgi:transposase